jgi:hypothetical protein
MACIRCGISGDLFKDEEGHIWHIDDIHDLMQETSEKLAN